MKFQNALNGLNPGELILNLPPEGDNFREDTQNPDRTFEVESLEDTDEKRPTSTDAHDLSGQI